MTIRIPDEVARELGHLRARVEELLGRQVHLQIHVRVTPGWYENEARLAEFGYTPTED